MSIAPAFLPPLSLRSLSLHRLPLPLSHHPPTRVLCTRASLGKLYIVSTPIGHPLDLTPRARQVLQSADIIAAEDTRTTRHLLSSTHTSISALLLSCHEHNWRSRLPSLLSSLSEGKSVALVSDAGTPCISDPGAQLVQAAVTYGIDVIPIPGACAILAALVASGLPMSPFTFFGFIPRSGKDRRVVMDKIAQLEHTIILYEAPHRLEQTLQDLSCICNARNITLARELTKKYEQFLRFNSLNDALLYFQHTHPRGEFTLVLGPKPSEQPPTDDFDAHKQATVDLTELTSALVTEGVPPSSVARALAKVTQVPKKLLYTLAVECNDRDRKTQDDTKD